MDNGQIILYQTQGGKAKIEVRVTGEIVRLSADQMTELFQLNKYHFKAHQEYLRKW